MAAFLDIADEMKAALEAEIAADDLAVVVYRQNDLQAEFKPKLCIRKLYWKNDLRDTGSNLIHPWAPFLG